MKKKAILISAVIAVVCAAVVVGASFALFSKRSDVETYLSAGELNATLVRTDLKGVFVDENGILGKEKTVDTDVDLTNTDSASGSAFMFGDETSPVYNVPGVWEEATLQLTNTGNVAFDSSIVFSYTGTAPKAGTPEYVLASKLVVTVSDNTRTLKTGTLAQIISGGVIDLNARQLASQSYAFKIKIELPYESEVVDDGTGNTIMNANLKFTFTVTATQTVEDGAITE